MDPQDYNKDAEEDDYNELFKGIYFYNNVSCSGRGCRCRKNLFNEQVKKYLLMIKRYVRGQLPKNSVPTIGIEFAAKTVLLKNGVKIKA